MAFNQLVAGSNPARPTKSTSYSDTTAIRLRKNGLSKKILGLLLLLICSPALACLNVLASGQSNMCGLGAGGPSPITADSRVMVWNNANNLGPDGYAFISPPDFGNPPWRLEGGNNLALWFADAAARELETCVNLVVVCKGYRPISDWHPDEVMYQTLVRNYQLSGLPPADVFLWHQGESDKNTNVCTYKMRLINLIARLKNAGVLKYEAKTLVGGLRFSEAAAIDQALQDVSGTNIFYVSDSGLPDFDGIHFTGQALHDFGVRYWNVWND